MLHHENFIFSKNYAQTKPEDTGSHQLIVVASELDTSTERIMDYLCTNYGVPINAVFFRYYMTNVRTSVTRMCQDIGYP